MGAAAQLDRERLAVTAHGHDAHALTVFLTEQSQRTGLDRLLRASDEHRDGGVCQHLTVDLDLDCCLLLGAHPFGMADIEA